VFNWIYLSLVRKIFEEFLFFYQHLCLFINIIIHFLASGSE